MKTKLLIFINVFGLAIAMSCCIVGYFCYDFNVNFDSIHQNASTIYRVNSWQEFEGQKNKYGHVPVGLGNAVAQNISDVESIIRYSPGDGNFRVGQDLFNSEIKFVDPTFFRTFSFNFVQGNGSLLDKTKIVISESLSKRLFGEDLALGKSIDQILEDGTRKTFTVSGIFQDPPLNTSFTGALYLNFYNQTFFNEKEEWDENSWSYRVALFVSIPDPARLPMITSQLNRYTENNNTVRKDFIVSRFELEPFRGMGVRDDADGIRQSYTRSGFPPKLILFIGVIGTFVLLITCFNLINTFIAISSKRLKEIGIRKVLGSRRRELLIQFMSETTVICIAALLLSLFIANYILIPAFNDLWPHLKLHPVYLERPGFLIFTILVVSLTAVIAGSYPALVISKFHPIGILKGRLKFSNNNIMTYTLLMVQFAISLISLLCSLAFIYNSRFQSEFDFGFDKNGLVYTEVGSRSEFEAFKNSLSQNPDIISIAGSRHHLSARTYYNSIESRLMEINAEMLDVGDNYFETVGIELIEGRNFVNESETDRKVSAIVTEETVHQFGWTNPIGMQITLLDTIRLSVIGVIKNVYNNGLWEGIEPMVIRKADKEAIQYIIVSTEASKVQEINTFMGVKWKELFPDKIYEGRTINNELFEAIRVNNNMVKMSTFLGIVALLLSITGLFTLVSLNINDKMKEIGVRKVMGASTANLSWVLTKEFAIVVIIACLAGSLLGTFILKHLMDDLWKYHQPVTFLTLLSSIITLLLATVLSIIYKIYNTTRVNPSDILRYE